MLRPYIRPCSAFVLSTLLGAINVSFCHSLSQAATKSKPVTTPTCAETSINTKMMPTVYLNHGGGPMPILGHPSQAGVTAHLQQLRTSVPKPKAILIATAHWEEPIVTVSTSPKPPMLYDYYGFPEDTYTIKYPAPGSPEVAKQALELLKAAGIACAEDSQRGFDHGTFVPLMLAFPEADVPVVQMSLRSDLSPDHHLQVGRALAPLRSQGVLIVGSGSSFHNMRVFMSGGMLNGAKPVYGPSEDFDQWLNMAVTRTQGEERAELLRQWVKAPGARESHPREEHLLPLMVAAGAAYDEPAITDMSGVMAGAKLSGFMFGKAPAAAAVTSAPSEL